MQVDGHQGSLRQTKLSLAAEPRFKLLMEGQSCGPSADKNTVSKLLSEVGLVCAEYHDRTVRKLPCRRVQCDEIWSFNYAKQRNVADAKAAPPGASDTWTSVGICADTNVDCETGSAIGYVLPPQLTAVCLDDLRTSVKPSPMPLCLVVSNGSNRRSATRGATPGPLSARPPTGLAWSRRARRFEPCLCLRFRCARWPAILFRGATGPTPFVDRRASLIDLEIVQSTAGGPGND